MRILNLFQDLFISFLKVLVGVQTKDKPAVRIDDPSSVNLWSDKLYIIFLLYWEMYLLMELAMNLQNEGFHWFSGKRTFIDSGMYMRYKGVVSSRVISSVFMWLGF